VERPGKTHIDRGQSRNGQDCGVIRARLLGHQPKTQRSEGLAAVVCQGAVVIPSDAFLQEPRRSADSDYGFEENGILERKWKHQ
jgi:hypothetical protein